MSFINSIDIDTKSGYRSFELHIGDITELGFAVDGIIISAFAGGYSPVPGTIPGSFNIKGVEIKSLLQESLKFDYRAPFGVWVAEDFSKRIDYRYLFCLEMKGREFSIQESIKNLFTVLTICEMKGLEIKTIALPLLGTGNQKIDPTLIVEDLVQMSLDFLKYSRHLEKIIYIAYDEERATLLQSEMNRILGRNQIIIPRGEEIEKLKTCIKNEIEKIRRINIDSEAFRNIIDAFRRQDSSAYEYGSTSRKVLEFIIDSIIKPELNTTLFRKIGILNQSKIAKWYIQYFHMVREFGNVNVHHNNDHHLPSEMEREDVEIGLLALLRILTFFRKHKNDEIKIN